MITLKVDVCKMNYVRDDGQGLIMTFGIFKMRVSDQEDNSVDRQVDRI